MSSLYRCRARVGYRPFRSEQLIVFDERQIQELSVDLKWEPGLSQLNQDSTTTPTAATNFLNQSKCQVTISDPYLTGLAWPALYDAASIYTASTIAASNNILLPACTEGQDPIADKCVKYVDLNVDKNDPVNAQGNFALLMLSLWYDVGGTSFGTDFYFRVDGFSVSHGSRYPSVTIRGVEARSVLFNQSLVNMAFDEGAEIEKVLKDISEEMGYSVSFCANTNSEPDKKRLLPRSIRFKGVTPDEAIKKVIDSVGGNTLTLPTREYANKISMCTRGEIDQGCSVFYLGKGLYESYEINGQPDLTFLMLNLEQGSNRNNGDQYVSEAFNASSYTVQNITPERRKKALEKVKKVAFPQLFEPVSPHIKGAPRLTGFAWKDSKPAAGQAGGGITVINERLKDANLFGIAPNGTTAISYLSGKVREADTANGRVIISTKFFLQACDTQETKKCFSRQIRQETTGLSNVKVKANDVLEISQEIGSSTAEKPEFTRFFIEGFKNELVTLNPQIVWDWAVPEEELKDAAPKAAPASATNVVPPAPKATSKDWSANTTQKPKKVLLMAGHADFPSGAPNERALNVELVKWAQRNAASYGISDFTEFYFPPSSNIPESDSRSQFKITEQAVASGKQVIEIHNDEVAGKSGVIPPRGGKNIWQSDNALASSYGAFSVNHRDGLGIPNRGGTILEVGRMDAPTTKIFVSGTPAQKEALYKQLMDPTMRAIAAEKARSAGTAAPQQPSSESQGILLGRVGGTGRSSAPHVHFQFSGGPSAGSEAMLTNVANKYFLIGNLPMGSVDRNQGYGAGRNHKGIDFGFQKAGQPVYAVNGASVKQVVETKCTKENSLSDGCGGGFGNHVIVSTPEGEVLIAHLAPQSIPPNIAGLRSSSGGGKTSPNMQAAPATQGLTLETGFKGVPRSLRIIPGRTILSLISDYDSWVENGGPRGDDNGTDPGIWIPSRFKNWFITQCKYKWRDGDLRVDLEGRSAWGTRDIKAPTFPNYLASMRNAGELKNTTDYYGYMRSLGDLHWKTENGKDSTEELCGEAQYWSQAAAQGPDTTTPANTQGSFPAANCQTGNPTQDAIINALYSSGLKTQNGFAGVLANMEKESGVNFNIHNTSRAGNGCTRPESRSRILGSTAYGLVQWCGSRADALASTYKCGRNCSLDQQLSFLKGELQTTYKSTVNKMNNAKTPEEAMEYFMREFEVPANPEFEVGNRSPAARSYFNKIKCNKPTP